MHRFVWNSQIPLAADWREVLDLAGVAAHARFKPVAYIENTTTDTEVLGGRRTPPGRPSSKLPCMPFARPHGRA